MRPHLSTAAGAIAVVLAVGLSGCAAPGSGSASGSSASGSASASAGASAAVPLTPERQDQLQQTLDKARKSFGFPGAQVGVWTADGSWIGTTGSATPGQSVPITKDMSTRIGGITSTFTGTVVLQLAAKKQVSLDDAIGKYVPGVPNANTATLANLLSMTSGIPNYTENDAASAAYFANPDQAWEPQQIVDSIKTQPADFPAGARYEYSDTNAVLLGMVIEQVTNQSFADALQSHILAPLGLTHTSFPGSSAELPTPHLSGITNKGQPTGQTTNATDWNPSWAFTYGAMISTLDDLKVWAKALATGEGLLNDAWQRKRIESLQPTVAGNAQELSYGYGVRQLNGWIGNTGEIPGYSTVSFYHPELKSTLVVMVNSDVPTLFRVSPATAIAGAMFPILEGKPPETESPVASASSAASPSGSASGSASESGSASGSASESGSASPSVSAGETAPGAQESPGTPSPTETTAELAPSDTGEAVPQDQPTP